MFYLVTVAVLSGAFVTLFALWLLIWTFTMSDMAELRVEKTAYTPD